MINKLKKILKQEDTVLFIGSGISLWSGLPSWSGLIIELIDFIKENGLDASLVEHELRRGDLLQAASYGFDKLTKLQFAQFIRATSRIETAQPHDIHCKIVELGPTCYITTNYDRLLELSFQKWKSEIYFRSVVNTQLIETAEIVGARSNRFLFKLHGDAENSDSIILTREQYRKLNPGGELNHALETAKTLMLSRPIVYFGFGLRDPDFLYLRDLLNNTYKGGTRDHYAIMADIGEQEKDYWRRNFGIHLLGYETIAKSGGKRDHTPILDLLDHLKDAEIEIRPLLVLSPEFILNLNRHSAKYYGFQASKLHLPLIVQEIEKERRGEQYVGFYDSSIENLLDNGPGKFILIGLPGAGKSYSIKASVARLAIALSRACIEDSVKINETIIPIYVDLKLYEGDLVKQIEQNIPIGIDLSSLCTNFKVKLYLDAFNELPKEFIESKSWNVDFSTFTEKYNASIVISSRTTDGLEDLDFPAFNLDSINRDFIKESLAQNQLELISIFRDEVIDLLQKPFFYKLIFENKFEISSETTPQKIYMSLLSMINSKFNERFGNKMNLIEPLSRVAIITLNNGEEAFKAEILAKDIDLEAQKNTDLSLSAYDVINWLVSQDFLIPLVNGRVCFFHQSITEYLSATRLALLFVENDGILKEKLSFRRWDQTLFLCLSLLKKEDADRFLKTVINIDFELALTAVKYLEGDSSTIVKQLLKEIIKSERTDFDWQNRISSRLRYSMPIMESHTSLLKKIVRKGNLLGGSAVCCLLDLYGNDFKMGALDLIAQYCNDYNFCKIVEDKIKKYIDEDDITLLFALCQKVHNRSIGKNNFEYNAFCFTLGNAMMNLNPTAVFSTFYHKDLLIEERKVHLSVFREYLTIHPNNESLKICIELLLSGIHEVIDTMYSILTRLNHSFIDNQEVDDIDYSIFEPNLINSILTIIEQEESHGSPNTLHFLYIILSKREDLKYLVEGKLSTSNIVLKAAYYYAISESENNIAVYKTLEGLLKIPPSELKKQDCHLLSYMSGLDWIGHEKLFIQLLQLRNVELADNLCEWVNLGIFSKDELVFDIGPIVWWLEWFGEFIDSNNKELVFLKRMPYVIAIYISKEKRLEFISEFNNPKSKYRKVLNQIILPCMSDLKLEEFTENSLKYFFEEISTKNTNFWHISILENIATEQFVQERMIPTLRESEGVKFENLKTLIERIGRKHNRRYFIL